MQCGANSIGILRHWFARGICSLQVLPLPELQARQKPLSCLEADSCWFERQLLPAPPRLLLAPSNQWEGKAWHGTVWRLPDPDWDFPLEFFSRIPEIFSHLLGSSWHRRCSQQAQLLLVTRATSQYWCLSVGRGNPWQPGISWRSWCWSTKHVCRGQCFWTQAGENSRKPFFSIIQGRFFLPALNTRAEFSVTFTTGVSLDVLDFLLLSWCSSLMLLALDCAYSLLFPAVCVFSPSPASKPDILCLCSVLGKLSFLCLWPVLLALTKFNVAELSSVEIFLGWIFSLVLNFSFRRDLSAREPKSPASYVVARSLLGMNDGLMIQCWKTGICSFPCPKFLSRSQTAWAVPQFPTWNRAKRVGNVCTCWDR